MAKRKGNRGRPAPKRAGIGAGSGEAEASTRREKREEARRQRQAELLRIQRRRTIRKLSILGASAVAAILIILFIVLSNKPQAPSSDALRTLIAKAPAEAKAAGCGPVKVVGAFQPPGEDHAHIGSQGQTAPPLSSYPSVPPASGPHDPTPQDAGVYTSAPDIYKTIHSLEHGAVVFWYSPTVPESQLAADANFVTQYEDHTILAPYSYPSQGTTGSLPSGTEFALVSWQQVEYCKSVPGTAVLADFMSKYRTPTLGGGTFQGSTDPKLEPNAPI